jgi:hypothetical protein
VRQLHKDVRRERERERERERGEKGLIAADKGKTLTRIRECKWATDVCLLTLEDETLIDWAEHESGGGRHEEMDGKTTPDKRRVWLRQWNR